MNYNKKLFKFEIFSLLFLFVIGTLLHFTYDFFEKNIIIGSFSAVNESTWEHLKLIFFPMLFTTTLGYFKFKEAYKNYICIKTKSILLGIGFIVVFFYTYTGIIGTNFAILDISSFFIAGILTHYYSYNKLKDNKTNSCNKIISIIILLVLLISFIIFTFIPPKIGLFKDPTTNSYGIFKTK